MHLDGRSLIAGKPAHATAKTFHAISPLDGARLEPEFHEASAADVDLALRQADDAFEIFAENARAGRENFDRLASRRFAADDCIDKISD